MPGPAAWYAALNFGVKLLQLGLSQPGAGHGQGTGRADTCPSGPVSIAADASDWSSYTSGILTSDDCSSSAYKLDHAIQLVGYNEDGDTPYWIVRNSWSSDWGIDGYLYLEMGENTCGLADKAAIVTL